MCDCATAINKPSYGRYSEKLSLCNKNVKKNFVLILISKIFESRRKIIKQKKTNYLLINITKPKKEHNKKMK